MRNQTRTAMELNSCLEHRAVSSLMTRDKVTRFKEMKKPQQLNLNIVANPSKMVPMKTKRLSLLGNCTDEIAATQHSAMTHYTPVNRDSRNFGTISLDRRPILTQLSKRRKFNGN